VTPTDRSPAGCRLYDSDAVARLELVRTLRLLAVINGRPAPESSAPLFDWAAEAVRVRT
jgi:hypothetical protein